MFISQYYFEAEHSEVGAMGYGVCNNLLRFNHPIWRIVSFAILIGSFVFSGCTTDSTLTYVKKGKVYGKVQGAFRHRWWNYYERGLSFAEGEFYQEAIGDLKIAINQRAKDQRMARTYGMHFIDYFPHRELGIIYYQLEDLRTAKRELELSLSHFPSAKAQFYLDRVRKNLIEQEGKEIAPPRLTLALKKHEFWTREDPVVISGVAEDEHYISGITINKVPLFLELSQKRIPFEETLRLPQGRHIIEVVAKNLLGKVTKACVVPHVDREGPVITLEELKFDQAGPGREVTIYGSIYDEAGVSELRIDGQSIPIQEGVEIFFTERVPVDKGDLELAAQDQLGNQTLGRIPISSVSISHTPVMIACAGTDVGNLLVAGLFGSRDIRPPGIRLRGWTDSQTVFLEKIYIEGEIRDESKVESLTVNQTPILRRKGQSIFFSHLTDLKEGENTIAIEASDEAGNMASKIITVIRRVPEALQLKERLSLTVLPFEEKGLVSQASLSFQDNLIESLVNQNRFSVVERDKLDMILEEQNLSRTELIDRSTALHLGRLMAAHTIVPGTIIETRTGIEIVGRMVDTETSEIVATEDVYDEVKDLPALRTLAEGMAIKFHREFPLLGGLVIQQKGKYIFTDLGQDEIKIQRRLIVYREEPISHPITGKMLGPDNVIICRARVMQVMPEMSKAEIVSGKTSSIKRLDKVITE
jgi:TolB-like protein